MEHTTEQGSNLSVSLQITHPAQGRLATPPGSTSPTLLNSDVGYFTSHKNQINESAADGTYGFLSLSKRTRKPKHLQMSLQRQHFLLSYFEDTECWSSRGLNLQSPTYRTGALPSELTRRWLTCQFLGVKISLKSKIRSNRKPPQKR